jgi:hypothetical protein
MRTGVHSSTHRDRLAPGLVHVRRFERALIWISTFFNRSRGSLCRARNFSGKPELWRRIFVDASPWGVGGVLREDDVPTSFLADDVADLDTRSSATRGGPGFNAFWEALAILVALRAWRYNQNTSVAFQVRSDSLSAFVQFSRGHPDPLT